MTRIKEILRDKGMTVAELAEILSVSRQALSRQIKGKMLVETAGRIADALKVPLWQLFATPEEAGGVELNALIEHKGKFYKATTLKELESVVAEIKDKMRQE